MDSITEYAEALAAKMDARQAAEALALMPESAIGSPLAIALINRVASA